MFDKDKRYTIREIINISGQKQDTIYGRKRKFYPSRDIDKDGVMRFTGEEAERLTKFYKSGPKTKLK